MHGRIPTLPPTTALPRMITFDDCKKGETSAKTGCTPQEGGGGKEAGSGPKPVEMELGEAVQVVRDLPDSTMDGWLRNADKNYKPKIMELMEDEKVKNAGLNLTHQVHKGSTGEDISFDEFMDTPIKMYRAGDSPPDEPFTSYSLSKEVAEDFARKSGEGSESISVIEIKPRDTLGSYQTTAEAEVFIPSWEGKDFEDGNPEFKGRSNFELDQDIKNGITDIRAIRSYAKEKGMDLDEEPIKVKTDEIIKQYKKIRKEKEDREGHTSRNPHQIKQT